MAMASSSSLHRIQPLVRAQNQAEAPVKCHSRRAVISTGLAAALFSSLAIGSSSSVALAKDIPLFGIRPKKVGAIVEGVEKEAKALVKGAQSEVKELVKEAQSEVKELVKEAQSEVKELVKEGESVALSAEAAIAVPASTQAGAVLAAEALAVAVASSVVNGLVAQGSR